MLKYPKTLGITFATSLIITMISIIFNIILNMTGASISIYLSFIPILIWMIIVILWLIYDIYNHNLKASWVTLMIRWNYRYAKPSLKWLLDKIKVINHNNIYIIMMVNYGNDGKQIKEAKEFFGNIEDVLQRYYPESKIIKKNYKGRNNIQEFIIKKSA